MAEIKLPQYPIKSLPSGGIAYPANWEIKIEPYRFAVSSTVGYDAPNTKRFYNQILAGVHCNFPKKMFTVADVLFLGIARKLVSVESDKVTLPSRCPACTQKVETEMSFKEMIKFKASPIKDRSKYPVKVTFTNYIAWFKMLTVDDYIDLLSRETITPADRLAKGTYRLVEINPEDGSEVVKHAPFEDGSIMKLEDLADVYGQFIGRDSDILEKVLEIFEPIDLEPIPQKCTNPDCENEFKRTLTQEELTRVLQPFRSKSRGVLEDAIDL